MVRLHEEESGADLSEIAHLFGAIGEDANGAASPPRNPLTMQDR
jgi:hypothetical protein